MIAAEGGVRLARGLCLADRTPTIVAGRPGNKVEVLSTSRVDAIFFFFLLKDFPSYSPGMFWLSF